MPGELPRSPGPVTSVYVSACAVPATSQRRKCRLSSCRAEKYARNVRSVSVSSASTGTSTSLRIAAAPGAGIAGCGASDSGVPKAPRLCTR